MLMLCFASSASEGSRHPGTQTLPGRFTRALSIRAGGRASCTSTIQMATPYGLWRASASTRARNATPNNGMQRTRTQLVFHHLRFVRAADAGRSVALRFLYERKILHAQDPY